jgi:hypothetical protein
MARPRRVFSGQTEIHPRNGFCHDDELPGEIGTRQGSRWMAATHFAYRVPNGHNDPLSQFLVLYHLMNTDTEMELRSKPLTDWLENNATQLHWDAITVGKILSDLQTSFEAVLGEKQGILIAGRDGLGVFYHFGMTPGAIRLAYKVLDDLYRLARLATRSPSSVAPERHVSPLLECPSLLGEWKGAL